MKYYVVARHIQSGDEFERGVTEDKKDAIKLARDEWHYMSLRDQRNNEVEVRAYVHDIEDENCDCFDYDTIEWRPYLIKYNTGVGDEYAYSFENAKMKADSHAAYTQKNISIIEVDSGNEVACRQWYGVEYDADEAYCDYPIDFGKLGFYDDWCELQQIEKKYVLDFSDMDL